MPPSRTLRKMCKLVYCLIYFASDSNLKSVSNRESGMLGVEKDLDKLVYFLSML